MTQINQELTQVLYDNFSSIISRLNMSRNPKEIREMVSDSNKVIFILLLGREYTVVMGRMLDLPSVIELAPCNIKA
jgi:hypothetical protein